MTCSFSAPWKREGAWPWISYSVLCPWVCGRKLLEVKLPEHHCPHSFKKEKRKEKGLLLLGLFSLEWPGLPGRHPAGRRWEWESGELGVGSFYNPWLSRQHCCLCLIGGRGTKQVVPHVWNTGQLSRVLREEWPSGLEGPLVWTETLGRDKRERQ